MKKSIAKTNPLFAALLILALTGGNCFADGVIKAPADLNKMLVYVSTAPFTPVEGTFLVDGMNGDGMHFQKDVLNRTHREIAQNKADAINFFESRFGVSVIDPKVHFMGYEVLPEVQYRAVIITGENTPSSGWPVHDGGWMAVVMDPQGLDLGGEFAGTHVPAGTMFVFGNYLISKRSAPILLNYQAKKPIIPDFTGAFEVACEIFSAKYGNGQAVGGTLPVILPNGQMLINTRNVITFPPFGKTAADILNGETE